MNIFSDLIDVKNVNVKGNIGVVLINSSVRIQINAVISIIGIIFHVLNTWSSYFKNIMYSTEAIYF